MTMVMPELTRIPTRRALSAEAATELVGTKAPALEPNVALGSVITDAETGEPILAYLPLDDPAPLRRALRSITEWTGVQRQNVYRSKSTTFGYAPRRPVVLREACSMTMMGRDRPEIEALLEGYADQFSARLRDIDPTIVETDLATLGDVLPEWRIGEDKLWTSGVINDSAALPYHRDGFNFPTWSAMPVLRRGLRGGALHVPEYGLTVGCADATVIYFPGKLYVHGVTPLRRAVPDGYRFSVVYYALRGMRTCREGAEEARLGRLRRTEREADMGRRLAGGDTAIPGSGGAKGYGARQAFAGWRGTGMGDRPWNSEAPKH